VKNRHRRDVSGDTKIDQVLLRSPFGHDLLPELKVAPDNRVDFDLGKFFLERFAEDRLEACVM
jgi:hypothetical protein